MDTGIGRSPGTDYFRIADQLTGEELSHCGAPATSWTVKWKRGQDGCLLRRAA
jgi:hypothetical protein